MKARMLRCTLSALFFVSQVGIPVFAESTVRTLPTLLIKGTVESLNTAEDGQMLLKVKDRYGFETPIYLGDSVTMTQEGNSVTLADLSQGTNVEVEYNFDVNTAKRQGVVVVITDPLAAPTPTPAVVQEVPEPATEPARVEPAEPEMPAESATPPAEEPTAEQPQTEPAPAE